MKCMLQRDLSNGNRVLALLLRYFCKSKWDFSDKLSAWRIVAFKCILLVIWCTTVVLRLSKGGPRTSNQIYSFFHWKMEMFSHILNYFPIPRVLKFAVCNNWEMSVMIELRGCIHSQIRGLNRSVSVDNLPIINILMCSHTITNIHYYNK